MSSEKLRRSTSGEGSSKRSHIQDLINSDNIHDYETKKNQEMLKSTGFDMRPDLTKRFKSSTIKNIISKVLNDFLYGQTYKEETAEVLTKNIANKIRTYSEGEVYERYKIVVNVVYGERKGQGAKVGARCLWDLETDSCASDSFVNETIFCVATVYGLLFY